MAYEGIDDTYFSKRGLHGGVPNRVSYNLLGTAKEILPGLLEKTAELSPDFILFDGMCPWGYFVAKILKLPSVVSLALSPPMNLPFSVVIKSPITKVLLPVIFRDFGKSIRANVRSNQLAKTYTVSPLKSTELLNAPGDIGLVYTSRYFQIHDEYVPDHIFFVGWTEIDSKIASNTPSNLEGYRKLIYVSLGTINTGNIPFYKLCLEVYKDTDYRVVISLGGNTDSDIFGPLPKNITIHNWLPQRKLLDEADLFVSHGGSNSIHESLIRGVPILLVPQQEEQKLNALRVQELGAGKMLDNSQLDRKTLQAATENLLKEKRYEKSALQIGKTLRDNGELKIAVETLESLII